MNLNPVTDIPSDPSLRTGTLPNGFTYYILHNNTTKSMLDVYFVVKAGANQQKKNQLELAHVLEHLAFDGTIHFTNSTEYFQKYPAVIRNGYTDEEHTCFYLRNIPAENKELLEHALLFVHDIGHNLALDSASIERQRKIVWNELKRGADINTYMKQRYIGKVIDNPQFIPSDFEQHLTNLNTFKHSALIDYYNDWYWADNDAIIIVGDIDQDDIEQRIVSLFGDVPRSPKRQNRPSYPPSQWRRQLILVTDPEKEDTEILTIMKRPSRTMQTRADYDFSLKTKLFNKLINTRLSKIRQNPSSSLSFTSAQFNNRFNEDGPMFGALYGDFTIKLNRVQTGLKQILVEFEGIKQNGFTADEWQAAKTDIDKGLSMESSSSNLAIGRRYIDQFVFRDSYPGPKAESLLLRQLLNTATLEQVNQLAKELITDRALDIIILAPQSQKARLPNEPSVMKWLDSIQSVQIKPYQDTVLTEPDIKELISPAQIARIAQTRVNKTASIQSLGLTKIHLSNGATVILKPVQGSGLEKDKIYLQGMCPGGMSAYRGDDYMHASLACDIVTRSGLGPFNPEELTEFKKNYQVNIVPYFTPGETRVWGEAVSQYMEPMFQLLYEYFEEPKITVEASKSVLDQFKKKSETRPGDESKLLWDSLRTQMGITPNQETKYNTQDVSQISLDRAYLIYRQCFSSAKHFTFILTGDFELNKAITLATQYIGALPTGGKSKSAARERKSVNKLTDRKTLFIGKAFEPAQVALCFAGNYSTSYINKLKLEILNHTLETILNERLRKKEAGTYTVGTSLNTSNKSIYYYTAVFHCDPNRANEMANYALEEIFKLGNQQIDTALLEVVRAEAATALKRELTSAKFWMDYLMDQVQTKQPLTAIENSGRLIDKLTQKQLQKMAKKFLSMDRYFQITTLPKNRCRSSNGH